MIWIKIKLPELLESSESFEPVVVRYAANLYHALEDPRQVIQRGYIVYILLLNQCFAILGEEGWNLTDNLFHVPTPRYCQFSKCLFYICVFEFVYFCQLLTCPPYLSTWNHMRTCSMKIGKVLMIWFWNNTELGRRSVDLKDVQRSFQGM